MEFEDSIRAIRQPCTSSGNRQSAHTAFECSQKSRMICIKPCCWAAPVSTRALEVPSKRWRASFNRELSSAAGQAKNRRSTSRNTFSLPPSRARTHSHGNATFTAKSVTRASPSNGCGLARRADLNVQCHDQNSSRSTWKMACSAASQPRSGRSATHQFSIFSARLPDTSQCEASASRRCG